MQHLHEPALYLVPPRVIGAGVGPEVCAFGQTGKILLRGSAHMAAEFRRVVHPALPLCGIQLAVGMLKPLARHPIYLTMNFRRRTAIHIVQEGVEPLAEELTQSMVTHRLMQYRQPHVLLVPVVAQHNGDASRLGIVPAAGMLPPARHVLRAGHVVYAVVHVADVLYPQFVQGLVHEGVKVPEAPCLIGVTLPLLLRR